MEQDIKTPPHSAEAERGVLGAILLDTESGDDARVLDSCLAKGLTADSFFDPKNRLLFETLVEMSRATMPIDAVTLNDCLKAAGRLDAVGGVAAIQALVAGTPTTAHAEYYTDIVRQRHLLRMMIAKARAVETRCFAADAGANADIILGEAEKDFLEIGGTTGGGLDWKVAVDRSLRAMEKLFDANGAAFDGLSTGFRYLDEKLMGLKKGDMVVVAARPSVGKTSLAMNFAECAALGQDINGNPGRDGGVRHPTLVFSLEMSSEALAKRMLCGRAAVNAWRLARGLMNKEERAAASQRLFTAAAALKNAPLYIDDAAGLDVMDMRARARRMKRAHGIELIVIDYLQLCNCREYANQGRQLETSRISGQIKAMAKELQVPVVVLSQLSRANEQRNDKNEEPKLSDLRDSGAIEQDADMVLLIRRPCMSKTAKWHENQRLAIVNVAKNRNGETGDVDFNFYREGTRFGDRRQNCRDVEDDMAEEAEIEAGTSEEEPGQ